MKDASRIHQQLIEEVSLLKQRIKQLEQSESELKQAQEELKNSEEKYRRIIETSQEGIVLHDENFLYTFVNKRFAEMLGYSPEELIGLDPIQFTFEEDMQDMSEILERRKRRTQGISQPFERRFRRKDGSTLWTYVSMTSMVGKNGRFEGSFAMHTDITQRKQAEDALRESEQRLQALMDAAPIAITWADMEGNQTYINRTHYELFGYALEEIPTVAEWRRRAYPDPAYRETVPSFFSAYKEGKEFAPYEAAVTCKDGTLRHVKGSGVVVSGTMLLTLDDITERKRMEQQLHTASLTDELTGVHNRRGFITLSEQQLKMAERTKKDVLLFFADLDKMKLINDTLGHQEGDKALIELATILKEVFRESDIIGRIGGDEFAILAIDTTNETREILINRLYNTLDDYNKTEGRNYQLSLSIGTAHYNPETPSTLDELMAQADTLMYEEKRGKEN